MHGRGIGMGDLVQLVERVANFFRLVHEHAQLLSLQGEARHHARRAVEDLLVVIVAELRHLVADAVDAPAVAPLGQAWTRRRQHS